jgi:hypothetical protein
MPEVMRLEKPRGQSKWEILVDYGKEVGYEPNKFCGNTRSQTKAEQGI